MNRLPTLLLAIGVLCVSFSGILANRALVEATSLALAAWRLGFAALFFMAVSYLPSGKARKETAPLTRQERIRLGLAGGMLVLHFLTWYASLTLTTVAIATLLTCSTPLWTALISLMTGRERAGSRFWISSAVAGVGVALVIHPHGGQLGPKVLMGDALATMGGLMFSFYLWCIDGLQHISSQRIVTATYSVAAVLLWAILAATGGVTLSYSRPVWEAILLVALVPQILGHTLINNALRHFTANVVAFSILAEPVITAVLAHILLRETITLLQIAGGALVLFALGAVLSGKHPNTSTATVAEEL